MWRLQWPLSITVWIVNHFHLFLISGLLVLFFVCFCTGLFKNHLALILVVSIKGGKIAFVSQIDKRHFPAALGDKSFHWPIICGGSALIGACPQRQASCGSHLGFLLYSTAMSFFLSFISFFLQNILFCFISKCNIC